MADVAPVELAYPFTGRWLARNSPARRVPSHGTHVMGTTYAIDFIAVDERGRSAPSLLGYALTQARRVRAGAPAVAGNHVVIALGAGGPFVLLAHLRQGSVPGRRR